MGYGKEMVVLARVRLWIGSVCGLWGGCRFGV